LKDASNRAICYELGNLSKINFQASDEVWNMHNNTFSQYIFLPIRQYSS